MELIPHVPAAPAAPGRLLELWPLIQPGMVERIDELACQPPLGIEEE